MAKNTHSSKQELLFHYYQKFDNDETRRNPNFFYKDYQNPTYIQDNLMDKLRPYQAQSLRYLHYTQSNQDANKIYRHLLFNMATGSGKTMVMAGAILYLFKEHHYQNFIFFVHTDAIIQKTKENLLNPLSAKYLFNQPIEIEKETIFIEAVEQFPIIPQKNTIYLKLSTIHKIHDELKAYKENCVTYEDLKEIPLVLLGDEAHHFNAGTKAKNKSSKEYEEITWEHTIENILSLRPENRLFEFTATINLDNKDIYSKYKDKIIYQYDLKQFMLDGYSKKVMLLEADQNDNDKMLDAVLLSQYRKMIAIKHNITPFKPIILFKSSQITISKVKQDDFTQIIEDLTPEKIKRYLLQKKSHLPSAPSVWHKIIAHYETSDLVSIVEAIQEDFNLLNILNVNTADLLEDHPILLNTLENNDNPIRAIFAVAKLNEGWDVLNLYDIVRIKEKASSTKSGTDSEAQLIGRGARYYPFTYQNEKSYTRRFDKNTNELGILEQLHYHTINEASYIKALHSSLDQADIIAQSDGDGTVEHAKLKEGFKKSKIYKNGNLYFNEAVEIDDNTRNWESYSLESTFEVKYKTSHEYSLENLSNDNSEGETKKQTLTVDERYYYKVIQQISFYHFNNLQRYFPQLRSIKEFIRSEKYLGKLTINVEIPNNITLEDISSKEKLDLVKEIFQRIADNIRRNYKKFKGTYNFISKPIKEIIKDYTIYIDTYNVSTSNQKIEAKSTTGQKWYVYDNAILNQLEHRLVDLLSQFMDKLKQKYSNIYIIRNDEQSSRFKLIEFDGVRGFMPDFIMIMIDRIEETYYQVLLESKGDDRIQDDGWKEKMLEKINNKECIILNDDKDIRLIGIKFFSNKQRQEFIYDMENKLYDDQKLEDTSLLESINAIIKKR